jgi:serine protease Do
VRTLVLLLLCAAASAKDVELRIHVVRITTERSTFAGISKQTLAGPALPVGPDGLLMVLGFSLDAPERDQRAMMRVSVLLPDGSERGGEILRGHDDMRCTFVRLAKGANAPEPVPLAGAPLRVGDKAVVVGRYGERMNYAPWRRELVVEAAVEKPKRLYALRGALATMRGSIVLAPDGRLVGFLDTRPTFGDGDGLMVGVGTQTLVVVPADEYASLAHKPPAKAWIGVNLAPFDKPREEYFSVDGDMTGALVTGMSPGSPAARAGIRVHDLVRSIGGTPMRYERDNEFEGLLRAVQRLPLDQPLKCRVVRFVPRPDGTGFTAKPMDLTIVLTVRPVDFADAKELEVKPLGIRVKPATDDWRRRNNLPEGVQGAVVVHVERASPAQLAGLRLNDLLLAMDRTPIKDPAELAKLVAAAKKAKRAKIVLLVRRGSQTSFVAVEPNW